MRIRTFIQPLLVGDIATITFVFFLNILLLVFHQRVDHWLLLIVLNTSAIGLILLLCGASQDNRIVAWLRHFYMVAGVPLLFKEMHLLVQPIHPYDYDQILIQIDHWLFGVHPTQWLSQFTYPLITEILQIAYSSFYLLLVGISIDLYQRENKEQFKNAVFTIIYGFFLSYIGYLLVPAVGPRFILHEFSKIDLELPGIFITSTLRSLLNAGESIPDGTLNPIAFVQRDVFPSGHAQMTLIIMYLAAKYRAHSRWFLWITGSLLIIGTVYLRYHYVIDVIGGVMFFVFTIWNAKYLKRWWEEWRTRMD